MHPNLKDALGETLGVILYQEQVLRVAHDLAGMSYAEADGFRRAMTHDRTHEEMEKMRESFILSALDNGVRRDTAEKVYEQLASFAAYGFCKAHAVAYAILSYQTLWLKCHYPAEFLAAVLSNQPMGYYPPRVLAAEARRCGVEVLPPDVNRSREYYTVENGDMIVSLSQVKGITGEAVASILREREKSPFTSLHDFIQRVEASQPVLENLVKVGALDAFGERREMLEQVPKLLQARRRSGRHELFANVGTYLQVRPRADGSKDPSLRERLLFERELLSLDLSAHPLDFCSLADGFIRIRDLSALPAGQAVKIAGSVIRYQTPPTRTGKRVVYIILEDGTGVADVTVFSDVQEKCGSVLFRSGWLEVRGKIQRRGPKSLSIIADEVRALKVSATPR
jgi:error-prone DNA polymerase